MALGKFHEFASREELAKSLAKRIHESAFDDGQDSAVSTLGFSGGSTPKRMLEHFFSLVNERAADPWHGQKLLMIDERRVPLCNERSNMGMMLAQDAKTLNQNTPDFVRTTFAYDGTSYPIPLYWGEATALKDCQKAERFFRDHGSRPLRFAVLGMGTDGHTASWFPNACGLKEATDPSSNSMFVPACSTDGEERITVTLPPLIGAQNLVLHIEGDEKRAVFEKALQDGPADDMPIRHLLRHPDASIDIYWAP